MNHDDAVTELADRVLNVEIQIDDTDTDDAADITPDQARDALVDAGVALIGMPRQTSFDGCYHVDVTRDWWDGMVRSGADLDATTWNGLHVHLALI